MPARKPALRRKARPAEILLPADAAAAGLPAFAFAEAGVR
jgi:hypothetical protein